jgi:uncharacterized sulfatase
LLLSGNGVQAAVAGAEGGDNSRPNVILIISDDHGWTDYGFMKHPHVNTPALDRLATEGVTYTRGYVTTPLCSPSLASILTGLYPHQHGITGNDPHDPEVEKSWKSEKHYLRDPYIAQFTALPQLPRLLADAGYRTLHTGKFWIGDPEEVGFTHTMGDTGRHGGEALAIGRETMEPIYDFMAQAVEADEPFFVWYAPFLPHTPHNPPERLLEKYSEVRGKLDARYFAMVEWLDETIADLMAKLEETGLDEETLVIYLADNGWNRFGKSFPYDNGVRTPIILRWPEGVAARFDETNLAGNLDIMPTILENCGVELPENLPGIDLLNEQSVTQRGTIFLETFAHDMLSAEEPEKSLWARSCIEGNWKLIAWNPDPPSVEPLHGSKRKNPGERFELFDLEEDPGEGNNLADEHPEVVERLFGKINAWWNPHAE